MKSRGDVVLPLCMLAKALTAFTTCSLSPRGSAALANSKHHHAPRPATPMLFSPALGLQLTPPRAAYPIPLSPASVTPLARCGAARRSSLVTSGDPGSGGGRPCVISGRGRPCAVPSETCAAAAAPGPAGRTVCLPRRRQRDGRRRSWPAAVEVG